MHTTCRVKPATHNTTELTLPKTVQMNKMVYRNICKICKFKVCSIVSLCVIVCLIVILLMQELCHMLDSELN